MKKDSHDESPFSCRDWLAASMRWPGEAGGGVGGPSKDVAAEHEGNYLKIGVAEFSGLHESALFSIRGAEAD